MNGKISSQPYAMITEPYKQGPCSDCSVHGSESSRDLGPLEDNPWKRMLAKCPVLISRSGQEQHTEVTDESLKESVTHMYHAILYHLVYKTTKDQCESC
jgi:hypothetical protein